MSDEGRELTSDVWVLGLHVVDVGDVDVEVGLTFRGGLQSVRPRVVRQFSGAVDWMNNSFNLLKSINKNIISNELRD